MSGKFRRGLDDRGRDFNSPKAGEIREKRGDTKVETLRKIYGPDFVPGVRSDMKLETLRDKTGKSLSELVKGK